MTQAPAPGEHNVEVYADLLGLDADGAAIARVAQRLERFGDRLVLELGRWVAEYYPCEDVTELGDLHRFPFTVKQDLRDHYPFGMFAVPREQVVRVHGSSGTTGKPTVVGYTRNDIDTWASVMARSIRAAGGRAGDIVHVAYGYGLFTGGLGAHYGAERLGATVVPMSGGSTERQIALIADFRARVLCSTPSYAPSASMVRISAVSLRTASFIFDVSMLNVPVASSILMPPSSSR